MYHAIRKITRRHVLMALVFLVSLFLSSTTSTVAQETAPAVATLTGTAQRLVDQTIVDGLVVDETEVPITNGRIAIPELGIDLALAADGSFSFSDLPLSADLKNPTEVTVIFTAPGLGSFTYLNLRLGQGSRPNLTPQLIEATRVTDVAPRPVSAAGANTPHLDSPGAASSTGCGAFETGTRPLLIRVWENGPGQDGLVHVRLFKFYVKHVLPREWRDFWAQESLRAGAMAVRSFAWWHATHTTAQGHPKHADSGSGCYDVDAGTDHQIYNPFADSESTNAAVDATWDYYMIEDDKVQTDVVYAEHRSGFTTDACGQWAGPSPPPLPGNIMSQEGSRQCAEDGWSWLYILNKYYFAGSGSSSVNWVQLYGPEDTEGDGCTTVKELGSDEKFGGRRNPLNPYDFYDTNGDRVIDLINDILGVIDRWQTWPGGPPNPDSGLFYDASYDRGPVSGPYSWSMTAPDGQIDLINDILGVIDQWNHNCA